MRITSIHISSYSVDISIDRGRDVDYDNVTPESLPKDVRDFLIRWLDKESFTEDSSRHND